ncbi:MAG TPA: hypothetical protein VK618_05740, partial [Flavitalea sp.]|nr:hypothetical protein [Flavitalea sp.]
MISERIIDHNCPVRKISRFNKIRIRQLYLLPALYIILLPACSDHEPATKQEAGKSLFTLLSDSQTNVHFSNTLTEGLNNNVLMYEYFYNGGGVAI